MVLLRDRLENYISDRLTYAPENCTLCVLNVFLHAMIMWFVFLKLHFTVNCYQFCIKRSCNVCISTFSSKFVYHSDRHCVVWAMFRRHFSSKQNSIRPKKWGFCWISFQNTEFHTILLPPNLRRKYFHHFHLFKKSISVLSFVKLAAFYHF